MRRFNLKTDIYFDNQALDYLDTIQGNRAMIVCDEMMITIGHADMVKEKLEKNGFQVQLFSDIEPDPTIKMVTKGIKIFSAFQPEVVIAVGGGSVIDTAKGILYSIEMSQSIVKPLFICIPSTSGTGSEVTAFSVIKMSGDKLVIIDEKMTPDVAILDTQFVRSVPANVTADTGLDTLCHAIEAYVSTQHSDFSDALAEKTIKLVFDYLLTAYQNGEDIEARQKMHNASCMAGIAFTNAALGINHSLAHAIGGIFHLPHGRTNAVLMPHVIAYNAGLTDKIKIETAERYAYLAEILGISGGTTRQSCENLIQAIKVLNQALDVPTSLSEMGVEKQALKEKLKEIGQLALKDNCTVATPRLPNEEELIYICSKAFRGEC
ncbi:hypothetical protein DOK67_0002877 [Enterococcus sp. DIV0212c]|uniref:1-propanol dehydrogenase PduQ n=1 Tax=Enterococcus sp. DIV0212c TaxID=2230867 RepID=UPI001A9AF7E0|nr:1-propanol dehydrogenase PduQ [Enterococcus sp. DIV0212c]MBO1354395.1 iron-containing alcohol dehydrogenase [Enterococcus sp. DIV0212c]